jgi:hypothetical protein
MTAQLMMSDSFSEIVLFCQMAENERAAIFSVMNKQLRDLQTSVCACSPETSIIIFELVYA